MKPFAFLSKIQTGSPAESKRESLKRAAPEKGKDSPRSVASRLQRFFFEAELSSLLLCLFALFFFLAYTLRSQREVDHLSRAHQLTQYHRECLEAMKWYIQREEESYYLTAKASLEEGTALLGSLRQASKSAALTRELWDLTDIHRALSASVESLHEAMGDFLSPGARGFAPVQESYEELLKVGNVILSRDELIQEMLLTQASQMHSSRGVRLRLFLLLFFLLLLVLSLYNRMQIREMGRRITLPVATLIHKASLVGQGRLGEGRELSLPPGADQEISGLGEVFDEMAGQLSLQFDTLAENARIRQELEETRFKELQMQINPHFLFNTLNMISEQAYLEGAEDTVSLLHSAARMFRYSLDFSGKEVPLRQEIEELGNYVYIQEQRFGKRIRFRFDLDESFHQVLVPALTLEPLVENAIVHGIGLRREGNLISITTRRETAESGEERGIIEVRDNGQGMNEEQLKKARELIASYQGDGPRIGLGNVSSRLRYFYAEKASMEVESRESGGTCVRIRLPLE